MTYVGGRIYFVFTIKISNNYAPGEYEIPVLFKCQDGEKQVKLKVSVPLTSFLVSIKDISEVSGNKITLVYNVKETSGQDSLISMKFKFIDLAGNSISEITDNVNIAANQEQDFQKEIEIPRQAEGEVSLQIEADSQGEVIKDSRAILLPEKGLTGFATFLENIFGNNIVSIIIILVAGGVLIFLVVKRTISSRRTKEERKGFIKIKNE